MKDTDDGYKKSMDDFRLLLETIAQAQTDDALDNCISEDIIPIRLLYKEFWRQFQDLIYVWCGEYEEGFGWDNRAYVMYDAINVLVNKIKIFEFDIFPDELEEIPGISDGKYIFLVNQSEWRKNEKYEEDINILLYNDGITKVDDIVYKTQCLETALSFIEKNKLNDKYHNDVKRVLKQALENIISNFE